MALGGVWTATSGGVLEVVTPGVTTGVKGVANGDGDLWLAPSIVLGACCGCTGT